MRLHQVANIVIALLAAALAPAIVLGVVGSTLPQITFAFVLALIHSFVLGLPVFLILRNKVKNWGAGISVLVALIAGFAIGAIPWGAFTWPLKGSSLVMKTNTWIGPDHVQTVRDGIPTLAGWLEYIKGLLMFGAIGVLGGFAFWVTLKLLGDLPSARKEEVVEGVAQTSRTKPFRKRIMLLFSGSIVILTVAVCAIPVITADRSCHNMFRDGRTSIGPVVVMDLLIADDEWPKFTELLQTFATTHDMSFRDDSDVTPDVVRTLYLSVCNENGVNIEILEQRWAPENYEDMTRPSVSIDVFAVKDDTDWIPLTRQLINDLEAQWPSELQFTGSRGEIVPKPEILSNDSP